MNDREFNHAFPVGSPVYVRTGLHCLQRSRTESEAWTLDDGRTVVRVDGFLAEVPVDCVQSLSGKPIIQWRQP